MVESAPLTISNGAKGRTVCRLEGVEDLVEHLFSGSALCPVDAGGNLLLPRFVRETIARRSDTRALLIGAHECDPCLTAYDRAYGRILHADSERRRIAGEAPQLSHARLRRIFGFAEQVGFGESGAIVLPPMMRRRARIGAQALLIGAGGTFELWDPETALHHKDDELRELAAFHLDVQHAA
jgi:MraZ protein